MSGAFVVVAIVIVILVAIFNRGNKKGDGGGSYDSDWG